MKQTICDRCKKAFNPDDRYMGVEASVSFSGGNDIALPYDLCDQCTRELLFWVDPKAAERRYNKGPWEV